jgi:hypothetical protein
LESEEIEKRLEGRADLVHCGSSVDLSLLPRFIASDHHFQGVGFSIEDKDPVIGNIFDLEIGDGVIGKGFDFFGERLVNGSVKVSAGSRGYNHLLVEWGEKISRFKIEVFVKIVFFQEVDHIVELAVGLRSEAEVFFIYLQAFFFGKYFLLIQGIRKS